MKRLLPISFVIIASAIACATVQPAPVDDAFQPPDVDQVIEIVAERFLFTPSQVTVQAGTTIEFRLTSEDTDHGFRVIGPGDINVAIPKRNRGAASAYFVATEPGEYRFECSRICGAGHGYMSGVIRVTAAPDGSTSEGESR